jgi:hypothetical protein
MRPIPFIADRKSNQYKIQVGIAKKMNENEIYRNFYLQFLAKLNNLYAQKIAGILGILGILRIHKFL